MEKCWWRIVGGEALVEKFWWISGGCISVGRSSGCRCCVGG